MPPVLAVAQRKGGQSKSTTTVSIATEYANRGLRVLMIDLDGQASASLAVGISRDELSPSAADVLIDGTPIADVVKRGVRERLDVVTGHRDLSAADAALSSKLGREKLLSRAIRVVQDGYDLIILDCPPNLGIATVNAAVAAADSGAGGLLVPIVAEYLAMEGVGDLLHSVEELESALDRKVPIVGFLFARSDTRKSAARQFVAELRESFPTQVFETVIPPDVKLEEAPSFGQGIFEYAPASRGARAYRAFGEELATRIGLTLTPVSED